MYKLNFFSSKKPRAPRKVILNWPWKFRPMTPFLVSGLYFSPMSDNMSKRLFVKVKADSTTTSDGCSNSLPVLVSTYMTHVDLFPSYKTRLTYASVLNSKLSCSIAVGTTVTSASDFAPKSQPYCVQNAQYWH